jgi:hypothetical protein
MGLALDKQYAEILDAAENRRILYSKAGDSETKDFVSVNRWNFVKRLWTSHKGYQRSDVKKVAEAIKGKFDSGFVKRLYEADPSLGTEIERAKKALRSLEARFAKKDSSLQGCFSGICSLLLGTVIEDFLGCEPNRNAPQWEQTAPSQLARRLNAKRIPSSEQSVRSASPSSTISMRSDSPSERSLTPSSGNSSPSRMESSPESSLDSPLQRFESIQYFDSTVAPRLMTEVSETEIAAIRKELPQTNRAPEEAVDRFLKAYFNRERVAEFDRKVMPVLKRDYHLTEKEIASIREGYSSLANDYEGWVDGKAQQAVMQRNEKLWNSSHNVSLKSRVEWKYGLEESDAASLHLEELFSIKDPDEFKQRLEERAKKSAMVKFSKLCNDASRFFATQVGFATKKYEEFDSQFGYLFQDSIQGNEYAFDSPEKKAAFADTVERAVFKKTIVDLISHPAISKYAAYFDGKETSLDLTKEAREALFPKLLEIVGREGNKKEWPTLVNKIMNRYLKVRYASYAFDTGAARLNKKECEQIVQEAIGNVYHIEQQAAINQGRYPLLAGNDAIVAEVRRLAALKAKF